MKEIKKVMFAVTMIAVSVANLSAQNDLQKPNAAFYGESGYFIAPETKSHPLRTIAKGLYYTNPEGTYYSAARDVDESTNVQLEYPSSITSYAETRLVVPALSPVTFTNHSSDAASTEWQWNVYNYESLKNYGYITAGNSLSLMLPNRRATEEMYDSPILYSGEETFLFGEKNYISYMVISPVMHYLGLNDYRVTKSYATMSDGAYIFGTGNIQTSATESFPCEGMMQYFDKPSSPLYVDRFNIACLSKSEFFSSTQELTLTVYNVVEDENGNKRIGNQVLYTATANDDNINFEQEANGVKYGSIDFCNRDASLKLRAVVLDQPFWVVITGFNQNGVDIGVRGCDMSQDEASCNIPATYVLVNDGSQTQALVNQKYKLGMALTFRGIFDNIMVLNDANSDAAYNIIRVNDSGTQHLTEGKTEADGLESVPVYTACPWRDSNNKMNYYWDVDKDNSWVKGVAVDASQYEKSGIYGLKFTCEPLPSGLSGRSATLWLKGKGVTASAPIILLQGDINSSAIDKTEISKTASVQGQTVNLAGQTVGSNYKGIVIKNGKKILVK